MKKKNIVHYFYEVFQLKRIKHNGWYRANVTQPDSVAEHVLLSAQIGYVLAVLENADKDKVLRMLVFHDNPEARVGDMDKVMIRYVQKKVDIEKHGLAEQVQNLPTSIGEDLKNIFDEMEEKKTLEAHIVKDADYLEQAFQAMIYKSQGVEGVQYWLDVIGKSLRTSSAKKLFESLIQTSPNEWYRDLNDFSNC